MKLHCLWSFLNDNEFSRSAAYKIEITDGEFALVWYFKSDRHVKDNVPKVPKFGSPCREVQGHVNWIAWVTSAVLLHGPGENISLIVRVLPVIAKTRWQRKRG